MKILFISRWFPYPPINGSKLRIYNILRGLTRDHEVTLISFADEPGIDPISPHIQSLCEKIVLVPLEHYNPDGFQAKLRFFSLTPRYYKETYSPDMARHIEDSIHAGGYDLVIASQIDTAAYVQYFHGIRAIFDEVEIGVLYERYSKADRWTERIRNGLTWEKHRRYLSDLLMGFQACTVASSDEKRLLADTIPSYDRVHVLPNCIEFDEYRNVKKQPHPNTLIFTGSFRYSPNYEAMDWFIQYVYPLLRNKIPDVKLMITGDPAGKDLSRIPNVVQTGFLEDVRSLVANSWVSLAPMLRGGGTRLKILEAMALGSPVVATSKGAQGLDVISGENILIANTPDEFAEAVYTLLVDEQLRNALATNGKRLVREKYDWDSVMPEFLGLIQKVAAV